MNQTIALSVCAAAAPGLDERLKSPGPPPAPTEPLPPRTPPHDPSAAKLLPTPRHRPERDNSVSFTAQKILACTGDTSRSPYNPLRACQAGAALAPRPGSAQRLCHAAGSKNAPFVFPRLAPPAEIRNTDDAFLFIGAVEVLFLDENKILLVINIDKSMFMFSNLEFLYISR
ncbi:hypothetical protein EVAR_69430_1 [Eumeta japonica]|uniref:Uncharacterized protein n=1 Tax=Eumeta variegata TaxID=151549 RepID=A0A4C2A9W4_EUMVA|nr:hypothetical protein EVAR_69430_1 [Eumeta japonica]